MNTVSFDDINNMTNLKNNFNKNMGDYEQSTCSSLFGDLVFDRKYNELMEDKYDILKSALEDELKHIPSFEDKVYLRVTYWTNLSVELTTKPVTEFLSTFDSSTPYDCDVIIYNKEVNEDNLDTCLKDLLLILSTDCIESIDREFSRIAPRRIVGNAETEKKIEDLNIRAATIIQKHWLLLAISKTKHPGAVIGI